MQPKWYIILILATVLVGTVSGSEHSANNSSECVGCDSGSANMTENKSETFIFIQEASSGSFVKDSSGNYTLTMIDVVPYTAGFADRPGRDVGFKPMDKFLKGFNFGIHNPPNAAIILPDENDTSDMVVVELTNPQYNTTTKTLIYAAKHLKNYSFRAAWFQDHLSDVDPAIPERFGNIILVIDSGLCECTPVNFESCKTWCRNTCWSWKLFECVPCGGCCSYSKCFGAKK